MMDEVRRQNNGRRSLHGVYLVPRLIVLRPDAGCGDGVAAATAEDEEMSEQVGLGGKAVGGEDGGIEGRVGVLVSKL